MNEPKKNYKEVEEIPDEEFFKEAYAQMDPEKKSLYRTYKINLAQGLAVEETVRLLNSLAEVEYAEPNYIIDVLMTPDDAGEPGGTVLKSFGDGSLGPDISQ